MQRNKYGTNFFTQFGLVIQYYYFQTFQTVLFSELRLTQILCYCLRQKVCQVLELFT